MRQIRSGYRKKPFDSRSKPIRGSLEACSMIRLRRSPSVTSSKSAVGFRTPRCGVVEDDSRDGLLSLRLYRPIDAGVYHNLVGRGVSAMWTQDDQ